MGTVLASKIIADAHTLLNDTGVRWPAPQMLLFLNKGQLAVVNLKVNSNVLFISMQLIAGTRQTIPADGISFVGIDRNTNGQAVTEIERSDLDRLNPNWHTDAQALSIENYAKSGADDEKAFYVYPPAALTVSLDLRYHAIPADIAAQTSPILIGDEYEDDLLNYIMYRAYSIDTAVGSLQKATAYYNAFQRGLGIEIQADAVARSNA